jgi:hypothetical protein
MLRWARRNLSLFSLFCVLHPPFCIDFAFFYRFLRAPKTRKSNFRNATYVRRRAGGPPVRSAEFGVRNERQKRPPGCLAGSRRRPGTRKRRRLPKRQAGVWRPEAGGTTVAPVPCTTGSRSTGTVGIGVCKARVQRGATPKVRPWRTGTGTALGVPGNPKRRIPATRS